MHSSYCTSMFKLSSSQKSGLAVSKLMTKPDTREQKRNCQTQNSRTGRTGQHTACTWSIRMRAHAGVWLVSHSDCTLWSARRLRSGYETRMWLALFQLRMHPCRSACRQSRSASRDERPL